MKTLTLALLLASSTAMAETASVQVQSFNFTYDAPKGSGAASSFTMAGVQPLAGVDVAVEKIEDDFRISVTGAQNEEIAFKDAPAFIKDAQHMDISNFNLDLSTRAQLSMTEGNFSSPESELMLKGFSLDCQRDLSQAETMDQILAGCMKKMTVRSSDFLSESKKNDALAVIADSIQTALAGASRGETRVKSLKLNVENGAYDLAAEVKAEVSGKVSSNGNMSYDPANGLVTLKISQVKFSILNITSKVFDELKKQQSDKLKVKQPYVYLTIK